jgi:hypothetical protein
MVEVFQCRFVEKNCINPSLLLISKAILGSAPLRIAAFIAVLSWCLLRAILLIEGSI